MQVIIREVISRINTVTGFDQRTIEELMQAALDACEKKAEHDNRVAEEHSLENVHEMRSRR